MWTIRVRLILFDRVDINISKKISSVLDGEIAALEIM